MEMPTPDIPPDVVIKKKWKRLILPKSSQSSEKVIKQPEPVEFSNAHKKKAKAVEYIPNPYIHRPRTRPLNKLRLKHKIIANPELRY
jgi:hypothetical protein